jgi:exodeoxyribonuclease VII small subunit
MAHLLLPALRSKLFIMSKKSYKDLQEELTAVVQKLEAGDVDIDEAFAYHKKGEKLLKQLETYLKEAENTIKNIKS